MDRDVIVQILAKRESISGGKFEMSNFGCSPRGSDLPLRFARD